MTPEHEVDLILDDCFFAVGQSISGLVDVDYDAIVWLRDRYRSRFLRMITALPHVWPQDRDRLMAVSRYLGQRAAHHVGDVRVVDAHCITQASAEVEAGCQMKAMEQRAAAACLNRSAYPSAAVAANS
jgi:hypothetical protein